MAFFVVVIFFVIFVVVLLVLFCVRMQQRPHYSPVCGVLLFGGCLMVLAGARRAAAAPWHDPIGMIARLGRPSLAIVQQVQK